MYVETTLARPQKMKLIKKRVLKMDVTISNGFLAVFKINKFNFLAHLNELFELAPELWGIEMSEPIDDNED